MAKIVIAVIRIVTDVIAFAVVFTAMGVLQRLQPNRLGYFPTDETITLPYKSSTIPSWLLYLVSSLLIVGTIIAIELALAWDTLSEKKAGIPAILYSLYDFLLVAFFGYFVTIAIVDLGKVAVGRPRPNFIKTCNPVAVTTTPLGYVTNFTCQQGSAKEQMESIKSFPSGHSATAVYSAIFLCIYVQLRQPVWRIPALRVAYQVVVVALALVTCISRVVDYKHHATDVLAGAVLGLVTAFTVPYYMCQLFPRTPKNSVRRICSGGDIAGSDDSLADNHGDYGNGPSLIAMKHLGSNSDLP